MVKDFDGLICLIFILLGQSFIETRFDGYGLNIMLSPIVNFWGSYFMMIIPLSLWMADFNQVFLISLHICVL